MGKKKDRQRRDLSASDGEFANNPFAELHILPSATTTNDVFQSAASQSSQPWKKTAVYIRLSKKGRAGKVVTVLEFDDNSPDAELQEISRKLRRVLGTGGTCRENLVELQGDHRIASAGWLTSQEFRVKGEVT